MNLHAAHREIVKKPLQPPSVFSVVFSMTAVRVAAQPRVDAVSRRSRVRMTRESSTI
jgi:hypothetical protein